MPATDRGDGVLRIGCNVCAVSEKSISRTPKFWQLVFSETELPATTYRHKGLKDFFACVDNFNSWQ
jgi:hypothetical protein